MEPSPTINGRERTKRVGNSKIWERIPLKLNLIGIVVIALSFLIFTKIAVSSLFLKLGPMKIYTTTLAQAEETDIEKTPLNEEKERILRKKERELNEREMNLERREKNLIPLKNEIDTKLEELMDLQTRLTAFARDLAEREKAINDRKISHLVSLYSSMEPSKAARIMDKLNTAIIVKIMSNMKGKSAGDILAMMEPERGAIISEQLSLLE